MNARFSFDFELLVWNNLRRAIRALGSGSTWFKILSRWNGILEARAEKATWIFNQTAIETAEDKGLDWWGQRPAYSAPRRRNEGESDDDYRDRLLEIRAQNSAGTTLGAKETIVQSFIPDGVVVTAENVRGSVPHQENYRVGSNTGTRCFSRIYIRFRYRFWLGILPDTYDREKLNTVIEKVNVGGNVPEFREDRGPFLPMIVGASAQRRVASRRAESVRLVQVF